LIISFENVHELDALGHGRFKPENHGANLNAEMAASAERSRVTINCDALRLGGHECDWDRLVSRQASVASC